MKPFVGAGYQHDGNTAKGNKARFAATLPSAGHYEVRLAYTSNANRASNVPVAIEHARGTASVLMNHKRRLPSPVFSSSWATTTSAPPLPSNYRPPARMAT
jgi:hypothetical protein